jgi:hypothetical protein
VRFPNYCVRQHDPDPRINNSGADLRPRRLQRVIRGADLFFFSQRWSMVARSTSGEPGNLELARICPLQGQCSGEIRLHRLCGFPVLSLKIAATTCVIGAIDGRWIGADVGYGALIIDSTFNYRSPAFTPPSSCPLSGLSGASVLHRW